MNAKNIAIKLILILLFNVYNSSLSFSKDTIKIGTLLPYSGVYTVLGEEITNAMSLAFEEVNNTVNGKNIEIIRGDTEVKPNIALQKSRKLISSDKVDILVGPVSSISILLLSLDALSTLLLRVYLSLPALRSSTSFIASFNSIEIDPVE